MTMALSALTVALLTGVTVRLLPAWRERGIQALGTWPVNLTVQAAVALSAAWLVAPVFGAAAAVGAAAAAWLSVLAVSTDLACRKIPYEIAHPVALVGLAAAASTFTTEGLLAFGFALTGLVLLPLLVRAVTNQGLGMSDVRLLWAYTATLSWWVGQDWLIYGLLGAAGLQILVRIVAAPFNLGDLVPRDHTINLADVPPADRHTIAVRRELPFAPAIVTATAVMVGYATATGIGACAQWAVTTVCR